MKYKILASSIILAFSAQSQAAWPTINIGDIINRMFMSAGFNGVAGQVSQLNATTQAAAKKAAEVQGAAVADQGSRLRVTMAQQDVYNKVGPNIGKPPGLQECVDATKKQANSAAVAAAGGGGGGGKPSPNGDVTKEAPKKDADRPAQILQQKAALDACTVNDKGITGCDSKGVYAGGDIHPRGMDGDMAGIDIDTDKEILKSYTISKTAGKNGSTGWGVAQQNIYNQTKYAAPKGLTPDQLSENQGYAALTAPMNAKLNAASEALLFSARMRQESASAPSGVAGEFWNSGSDYKKVTGLAGPAPSKPSLYDVVNYSVMNAYTGKPEGSLDEEELNRRLALSNFILWKTYQQQEQTNRLLANILTQMVTPVSASQIDNAHQKASLGKAAGK